MAGCSRRFPPLRSNALPAVTPQGHPESQPNFEEDSDIPLSFFDITEVIDVTEPTQIILFDRVREQVDTTLSWTALPRLVRVLLVLLVLCISFVIQAIVPLRT
ncbi:hypothetical protein BGX21_003245 [Mortierella sp. AD011]|nr:hypothetical protein BGX20_005952 [Mortierella sp. AD010]KAF9377233.1 hypothetical protein BGX21_003245 [Mortierella sp. AD011]